MSKLDDILADYYGEGDTSIQPEAKQQIKALMLELINSVDVRNPGNLTEFYIDGDELSKKVEDL